MFIFMTIWIIIILNESGLSIPMNVYITDIHFKQSDFIIKLHTMLQIYTWLLFSKALNIDFNFECFILINLEMSFYSLYSISFEFKISMKWNGEQKLFIHEIQYFILIA